MATPPARYTTLPVPTWEKRALTAEAGVAFSVVSTSVVGTVASVLVLVTIYLVSRTSPGLGSVPIAQCLARGKSSARTCDVQKECDRASGGRFSV